MRVVVTGAGGFLGAAVCRVLGREGYRVLPVVRTVVEHEAGPPHAVPLDLSDPRAADAIVSLRPDALVHFAACKPSAHLGPEAERVASINHQINATAFQVLKRWPIKIVFASSISVYGAPRGLTIDEQSPANPPGPYASEKLESEAVGAKLAEGSRVGFVALRIGAPYGPEQRAKTVLRTFIENARQGLPLEYHGTGSREQDFVFDLDVAEAVRCAIERGRDGVYNVATGRPVTMKRLAELTVSCVPACRSVVKASGYPDPQEGATAGYSIQKIRKDLGWRPSVSLEEGIRTCVREYALPQPE